MGKQIEIGGKVYDIDAEGSIVGAPGECFAREHDGHGSCYRPHDGFIEAEDAGRIWRRYDDNAWRWYVHSGLTNGQEELIAKGELVGTRSDEVFVLVQSGEGDPNGRLYTCRNCGQSVQGFNAAGEIQCCDRPNQQVQFSLESLSDTGVAGRHQIGSEADCRQQMGKLKAHYANSSDPIY